MTRPDPHSRGFSLVELMVAITVAAILAVIAVPNLRNAIRRNNVSNGSNTLLASISYARTEAISRGVFVSICPSTNGTSCDASSKDYSVGWLVYSYTPGNGAANAAYDSTKSSNLLLRRTNALKGVAITAKDTNIVSFDQQGQLKLPGTTTPSTIFMTCYLDGSASTPTSSAAIPGAELDVNGSGSIASSQLAAGASCTPS